MTNEVVRIFFFKFYVVFLDERFRRITSPSLLFSSFSLFTFIYLQLKKKERPREKIKKKSEANIKKES